MAPRRTIAYPPDAPPSVRRRVLMVSPNRGAEATSARYRSIVESARKVPSMVHPGRVFASLIKAPSSSLGRSMNLARAGAGVLLSVVAVLILAGPFWVQERT